MKDKDHSKDESDEYPECGRQKLDLPEEYGPFDGDGHPMPHVPLVRADGSLTPHQALVRIFENALEYLKRCPPDSKLRTDVLPPYDELRGELPDGTEVEPGDTEVYDAHREQVIDQWRATHGPDAQFLVPPEDEIESLMQMSCLNRLAIKCFAEAIWLTPQDLFETTMQIMREIEPNHVKSAQIDLKDLQMAHRMGLLQAINPSQFMGDVIEGKKDEKGGDPHDPNDEDDGG